MLKRGATVGLKVCGITSRADGEMLAELGVEALGSNFFPKSKRFLTDETAAEILPPLAGQIERVGVFVNEPVGEVIRRLEAGWIDAAQLHGDEPPEEVEAIKNAGFPVVKALPATEVMELVVRYAAADAVLIDTPAGKEYGGTGKVFDWSIAKEFRAAYPEWILLLAGGIVPGNAAEAISAVGPDFLDVASGAESAPGVKDEEKIRALLAAARGGVAQ